MRGRPFELSYHIIIIIIIIIMPGGEAAAWERLVWSGIAVLDKDTQELRISSLLLLQGSWESSLLSPVCCLGRLTRVAVLV
jgi:hypothetical protein